MSGPSKSLFWSVRQYVDPESIAMGKESVSNCIVSAWESFIGEALALIIIGRLTKHMTVMSV